MYGDCIRASHANTTITTLIACGAVCHTKCVSSIPPCTDNQNDNSVPPPLPPKEERTSKKDQRTLQFMQAHSFFGYSVHGFWKRLGYTNTT